MSIEITINGKKQIFEKTISVEELLLLEGKQRLPLTVIRNGKPIQKALREKTLIEDSDDINIIVFLGGG